MRRPLSPLLLPSFPITGSIVVAAAAVSGLYWTKRISLDAFVITPSTFRGEVWRLVLYTLPHANFLHLGFNLYWFWTLGTLLEEVYGHAKAAGLFALFAAGSIAAEYALFNGGIGLSGVGYGQVGLLWVLSSRDKRFHDAIDRGTMVAFAGWFFLCIVLTVSNLMPIANVAHGVGALLGVLTGYALSAKAGSARALAAAGTVAVTALSVAGASKYRPRVSLSKTAGQESAYRGYVALQDGRNEDALRHYLDAVSVRDREAGYWFNLGIAYDRTGRHLEAARAFRRASAIDVTNPKFRDAAANVLRALAQEAQEKGALDDAIGLYRESIDVDDSDALTWQQYGLVLRARGRAAQADEAFKRALELEPRLVIPR